MSSEKLCKHSKRKQPPYCHLDSSANSDIDKNESITVLNKTFSSITASEFTNESSLFGGLERLKEIEDDGRHFGDNLINISLVHRVRRE